MEIYLFFLYVKKLLAGDVEGKKFIAKNKIWRQIYPVRPNIGITIILSLLCLRLRNSIRLNIPTLKNYKILGMIR
jgi:hypothetical protein